MEEFDLKNIVLSWMILFTFIAIVFFVWTSFSRLARDHNKTKWLYGILGLAIFVIGINIGGIIGLTIRSYSPEGSTVYSASELLKIPIGILVCWIVYQILKKRWSR